MSIFFFFFLLCDSPYWNKPPWQIIVKPNTARSFKGFVQWIRIECTIINNFCALFTNDSSFVLAIPVSFSYCRKRPLAIYFLENVSLTKSCEGYWWISYAISYSRQLSTTIPRFTKYVDGISKRIIEFWHQETLEFLNCSSANETALMNFGHQYTLKDNLENVQRRAIKFILNYPRDMSYRNLEYRR